CSVLQILLLDVFPDFLGHFGTRQRFGADDFRQRCRRGHFFHEGGVGLARSGRLLGCRGSRFWCCCFGRSCCLFSCRLRRCSRLRGRLLCRRCGGFFGCCHLRAS